MRVRTPIVAFDAASERGELGLEEHDVRGRNANLAQQRMCTRVGGVAGMAKLGGQHQHAAQPSPKRITAQWQTTWPHRPVQHAALSTYLLVHFVVRGIVRALDCRRVLGRHLPVVERDPVHALEEAGVFDVGNSVFEHPVPLGDVGLQQVLEQVPQLLGEVGREPRLACDPDGKRIQHDRINMA